MISQKMQDVLNSQIQAELNSAYMYLAMSAYCDAKSLRGFGHWLKIQFEEELGHARKFIDHLVDRGGTVVFKEVQAPPVSHGTMIELFDTVLAHERHITEFVHGLHEAALAEKDVATQVFLQWFITEQVEEEATVAQMVDRVRFVGDRTGGLLYIDKEAGKRTRA